MKFPSSFLLIIALLPGGLPARLQTTSECYVTTAVAIAGATDDGPGVTAFSFPFFCQPVAAGRISAIASNWLNDASADWLEGEFDPGTQHYFLLTETGHSFEILATDAPQRRLQLLEPISPDLVGQRYTIYRHHTLDSLFSGALSWIGRAANFASADNLLFVGLLENQTSLFFYSNYPGYEGWYDAHYQPSGQQKIFPESGVYYIRRQPQAAILGLTGRCLEVPYLAPLGEGYSLVGTLSAFTPLSLDQAGLYTGHPQTGLVAGPNHTSADKIYLGTESFFYSDQPGHTGWYTSTYEPAGQRQIAPLQAVLIQRRAGHGNFTWRLGPQP